MLPDATKLAATLTLSGTTGVARGGSVTLSGTLSLGAGYALTVTRRDLAGTHTLPAGTTTDGGAFTISDTAHGRRAGSCVRFTAQAYVQHAWHTVATAACLRLDSTSPTAARMYGSRPATVPLRMQAVFTGDTANTAAAGSWYNFRFTK